MHLYYIPDVQKFWKDGDFEKRNIVRVNHEGNCYFALFSQDPALGVHENIEPTNYLFGDAFFFRNVRDCSDQHYLFEPMTESYFPGDNARKVLQLIAQNPRYNDTFHLNKDFSLIK